MFFCVQSGWMTIEDLGAKFKEMKFTKIDDFMADVDLTDPFVDENNNHRYNIGAFKII